MSKKFELEICLDSVASCISAEQGGADRVELCDNLFEGGTTPSAGAIRLARESIQIQLAVMIRPRGGDFLYSDLEFRIMEEDLETSIRLGADTVVFGLLMPDGTIDVDRTARLVDCVNGRCKITFHRAFDVSSNLPKALEDLISLGIDRVLTSGGEPSVLEGSDMLAQLVKQAGNRIMVMAGCGINARNFNRIDQLIQAPAYHMTAYSHFESAMKFRNDRCFMGKALYPPEFALSQVDSTKVAFFNNQR